MAARTWKSGTWGEVFTRSPPWSVTIEDDRVTISAEGRMISGPITSLRHTTAQGGFIWGSIRINLPDGAPPLDLGGVTNFEAEEMLRALNDMRVAHQRRVIGRRQIANFDEAVASILEWSGRFRQAAQHYLMTRGWLNESFCTRWTKEKPERTIHDLLSEPAVCKHLESLPQAARDALTLWQQDLTVFVVGVNKAYVENQLALSRDFFERVEKSPLTEE